jgi:DNA-binding SARP family transcriptional activator
MEFKVLGPLEVHDGNRSLAPSGQKPRLVLAVLLLHPNQVVSTDTLIEALWGEAAPATAVKAVQVHVSRLRKLIAPDILVTRPPGYELRVEPGQLDLQRFEEAIAEARTAGEAGHWEDAAQTLSAALALWRGPPLADLRYEAALQADVARLEELRLAAIEDRLEADLVLGRHPDVIGELEALTAVHPLRERLCGQLMLALYRSGRQADALEAYRVTRGALVEELGIEPGRRLRELHQAILEQDPGLDPPAAGRAPAESAPSTFVGRAPELAELIEGLDDAFAGRGRLLLLVGEPGIGKSRLAEELVMRAKERGANVLLGRCWEAGGAPAYWPWVQSLRGYVRESDEVLLREQLGAGAGDLAQILPELRERFPDLPAPPALESDAARFRLFDAVAELLRNASESRPIVLVIDDLHAADAPSLLLLRFLARQLAAGRILVLGAFRDVDPTPGQPLTEMLAEVAREPGTRRIGLTGLSEDEVAEYVELTASEIGSPELVAALHEDTEGNPLFVGEIVRLLAVEGIAPQAAGEARIAIPQSVRDVISRRLAHLDDECNRVLVLASVTGREFELDGLAHMAGVSEDELLETLDEAMVARVVADVPGAPGRLRFTHVLIRDTLYEELTTARRVRLHRLAVQALEALYGDEPGPHLAELAHHSIAGSDFDRGFRYARRAGERALALLAYEEAERLCESAVDALDLAREPDDVARCGLFLTLGEAQIRSGDVAAARRTFLAAARIARELGLARELAAAAAGYGGRFMWARAAGDERLMPLLEEGLAAIGDQDVVLRSRLLARLAGALRDEHSRERRDRLSREAIEVARASGNPDALVYALDGRCAAISAPDTVDECLALAAELREVAEQIGDTERMANALDHARTAQFLSGQFAAAEEVLELEFQIAQDLRQPSQVWQVRSSRSALALAAGRLAEAEELIRLAFEVGEHAQPAVAIPVYRLHRQALWDFKGNVEEVAPEVRAVAVEYPTRPAFRCALACVEARVGRTGEAQRIVDQLRPDGFSALPFDQEWLFGVSHLAEACALLGDSDAARALTPQLEPWADFAAADHPEGIRGSVARYLGLLATTTQDFNAAERHFDKALEMNRRMGALPWLAHTQHDYASLLLTRDAPEDRERAGELLTEAIAVYEQLDMSFWADRARALAGAQSESSTRSMR